jgi:hypothetical protein
LWVVRGAAVDLGAFDGFLGEVMHPTLFET